MGWLHTWAGVVLGALLFAIFWMGTLSVFDREIDRWMMPATRLPPVEPAPLDTVARAIGPAVGDAAAWYLMLPTPREPAVRLVWRAPSGEFVARHLDPATGRLLPDAGTWAGTRFIFPFHFSLHLRVWSIGYWLVGLAGMAMLVLCVTGVIIHKQIFADFFTFRVRKRPRRVVLDLHTVVGVLGFPFHVAITLSGLVIFFAIYFPAVRDVAYDGERRAFNAEAYGSYTRPKAGEPATPASLDAMAGRASGEWKGGRPSFVRVWHPGDRNSYVEVRRSYGNDVTMNLDVVYFDAPSGEILSSSTSRPVMTAQRFISGIHFIQFEHWSLRWLYFGLGLAGCVLIATGFLFWLESRRRRHEKLGLAGVRIVEGLTVGGVTGIVAATLAFFVVNRLLPLGATWLGIERYALEIWAFFLVWLATFAHAWLRPSRAWIDQCWTIAALATVAVLLNWATTGHHLAASLAHRHLWPIAGMDLLLLAGAAVAAAAALGLQQRPARPVAAPPRAHAVRNV
jgi:uncharacterized iron-regulated membrane protein